jgi:tetratricopeptide (TPR) repeat protein
MSNGSVSAELKNVLKDLGTHADPLEEVDPALFEQVARWRRSCGDAEGAATWQTWSLVPPEREELKRNLSQLWLNIDETELAAQVLDGASGRQEESWEHLTLLLKQAKCSEATTLQQKLLRNPPDLSIQTLLALVEAWKQAEHPQQALDLLQPMLLRIQKRNEIPSAPVCNTVAQLLDELKRFDEGEQWWLRSHRSQPQQTRPLMRLARHALRKKQFPVVVHYSTQVLNREPDHRFAPDLQRKGLAGMGASKSLAMIQGETSPQPKPDPHFQPPEPELWLQCRQLALVGFSEATLLEQWFEALAEETSATNPSTPQLPLKLWLVASPDPLWLQQQVETLRSTLDQAIDIEQWPSWDPQRHGTAQLILEFAAESPGWRKQPSQPC